MQGVNLAPIKKMHFNKRFNTLYLQNSKNSVYFALTNQQLKRYQFAQVWKIGRKYENKNRKPIVLPRLCHCGSICSIHNCNEIKPMKEKIITIAIGAVACILLFCVFIFALLGDTLFIN